MVKLLPTLAGLGAIPFIVKPIDATVDTAMEMSVTKVGLATERLSQNGCHRTVVTERFCHRTVV